MLRMPLATLAFCVENWARLPPKVKVCSCHADKSKVLKSSCHARTNEPEPASPASPASPSCGGLVPGGVAAQAPTRLVRTEAERIAEISLNRRKVMRRTVALGQMSSPHFVKIDGLRVRPWHVALASDVDHF